jgi:hypothetical protein
MRMERKRGQRRLIYSVSDKYLNDVISFYFYYIHELYKLNHK